MCVVGGNLGIVIQSTWHRGRQGWRKRKEEGTFANHDATGLVLDEISRTFISLFCVAIFVFIKMFDFFIIEKKVFHLTT